MNYGIVYYVGTNLICWIILDIIYRNFKKYLPKETLARTEVLCMIFWAMVACAADIVAGVFRGYVFAGSRALLITANLCYLVALVLVAFFLGGIRAETRVVCTELDNPASCAALGTAGAVFGLRSDDTG